MTNTYHTPIASGAAADDTTFNAPLGELDAELVAQAARIVTLEGDMPVPSGNPTEYYDGDGGWTVPAGTGASVDGHVIKDDGTSLPQRASIDFVGAGVTVTNEAGGTQVSIPGDHGGLTGLTDDDHPQYLLRADRENSNILINGGFAFFTRSVPDTLTTFANRTYWSDRWYTEHNASGGSGVQFRRWQLGDASIPSAPTYSDTFAEIKNASGGAAGILWSQPIESHNAIAMRGQIMMLTGSAMASTGTPTLKYKVFAWSGTRDHADCKKLVSSWNGSHVPTFNTTSLSEIASGSLVLSSSVWRQASVALSAPATNARNIVVCYWVEGLGAGESIYFSEAGLTRGSVVSPWMPRLVQDEMALCERFCEPLPSSGYVMIGHANAATSGFIVHSMQTRKRVTPTLTAVASEFSALAANGGSLFALSAISIFNTNPMTVFLDFTCATGLVAGNITSISNSGVTPGYLDAEI